MGRKRPNFFQRLWNKVKQPIHRVVTAGVNFAGGLVGIPKLGSAISAVVTKVPEETQTAMVEAVQQQQVIKTAKIEKTLDKYGLPVTKEYVAAVTKQIEKQTDIKKKDNTDSKTFGKMDEIKALLKKYWYLAVPGFGLIVWLFMSNSNNNKRNRRY